MSKATLVYAKLSGQSRDILESYGMIQDAAPATVAGEIRSSNPLVGYFAIRRADRETILGAEQIRTILKSGEPLHRAAAAAAAPDPLGPKLTDAMAPLIRDPHPAVVDAVLDALARGVTRTDTGKLLLDSLPRLAAPQRHKAMRLLGKLKYRPATGPLEEMFHRRDASDAPAACAALAAISGRSFMDGITEHLYPDNPMELHIAILECMAENPAPLYYAKVLQLLKTLRNRRAVVEVVRRIALWSAQGVDQAIALLGSSDVNLADAAQEGLVRHLRAAAALPPGFLPRLTKATFEKETAVSASSILAPLSSILESLESGLSELFQSKPDPDFQQLFFMSLTDEKRFLSPKLVQLAASRWGEEASKRVEAALRLSREDASLLRMRFQTRWAAQAEQHSQSMMAARMIESVGLAGIKSPVKEIARHLDTASLPIQMAAVGTLAVIGGMAEAAEMEKRLGRAHWMLKRNIATSLARLTKDNPTAGLFKLCEDPEPLVRIAAVRSLEEVRHEKAYNILLASLGDPDERVRSAACACLRGYADRKEAVNRLYDMLEDTDARVRANTIESLEQILSRDPHELKFKVKPFLTDPNARVVINAAKALFPIEPDLSMPVLESYLRAPDPNLRAGSLWALGSLCRPDAFLVLHFHSLREKDPYVRSFVDRAAGLMEDHLFYRDSKYLLMNTQPGGSA